MKRKLLILDAALAAAVVYAGFQLHQEWLAAKSREAATLERRRPPALPAPQYTSPPTPPAVLASGYNDIAQKFLLDRSRNPTVVVEEPPPPPPKPMPPLPVYRGMMNLDGVSAIMSVSAGAPQEEIRPGGMIGPFKLVDVNDREITLEWDGKAIHKMVDELSDHSGAQIQNQQMAAGMASRTAVPVAPPPPVEKTPIGPGQDTGRGNRTCDNNDSYPNGAVVDGYRKVVSPTPFGPQCRWDPVGR
ncbi:MAG: hypothetical protein LAP87_18480 [Acidobacteriia bacterium]|nr:hypothetical protein [Terriglobia bacterium]